MAEAVFVQAGDAIDYTPVADVAPGDVIVLGDLIGIARVAIPAETLGALAVVGVFAVAKGVGAGVTFSTGGLVYWDDTNKLAVATDGSGANKLLGKAIAAAGDDDATVRVRLSP